MTFREWAENYCYEKGMFEEDAKNVVDQVVAAKYNEAMKRRWNDDISDYPESMLIQMAISINTEAVDWIEKNCPQAWYKAMFDGTADKMADSQ